jgi:hypothetical protein
MGGNPSPPEPLGRPHEARGDARPRGMIDQLREGDFVERQNPAYELLCHTPAR